MLRNILDLPRSFAFHRFRRVGRCAGRLFWTAVACRSGSTGSQSERRTDVFLGVGGDGWLWRGRDLAQPVVSPTSLVAWPTASVALLVTSLPQYPFNEAVGAYIVCSIALIVLGLSGLFGKLMEHVPLTVIAGMMAGVLLKFGTNIFKSLLEDPLT